ncbi:hypothetical protein DFJ77DRAFT_526624 [Powellomyces hirtus]|nr:hypothetical protein DFJ77DRAFT_526624 [Powellomyces hirtus]
MDEALVPWIKATTRDGITVVVLCSTILRGAARHSPSIAAMKLETAHRVEQPDTRDGASVLGHASTEKGKESMATLMLGAGAKHETGGRGIACSVPPLHKSCNGYSLSDMVRVMGTMTEGCSFYAMTEGSNHSLVQDPHSSNILLRKLHIWQNALTRTTIGRPDCDLYPWLPLNLSLIDDPGLAIGFRTQRSLKLWIAAFDMFSWPGSFWGNDSIFSWRCRCSMDIKTGRDNTFNVSSPPPETPMVIHDKWHAESARRAPWFLADVAPPTYPLERQILRVLGVVVTNGDTTIYETHCKDVHTQQQHTRSASRSLDQPASSSRLYEVAWAATMVHNFLVTFGNFGSTWSAVAPQMGKAQTNFWQGSDDPVADL